MIEEAQYQLNAQANQMFSLGCSGELEGTCLLPSIVLSFSIDSLGFKEHKAETK